MNILKNIGLVAVIAINFCACTKKANISPDFDQTKLVPFSVEFDNIVGDKILTLNNAATPYVNSKGEPFQISVLQYFISNIKLTTTEGQTYTVNPDSSYFLIKGGDKSTRFAKINVPEGDYSKLTFTLGVDSLRSTMDITKRTGPLDPSGGMSDGMYWGWNAGYIFFKLEGNSAMISDDANGDPTGNKKFRYHIGGFGGYNTPTINNIKVVSIDLNQAGIARVRKDRRSNIHLFVDVMKFFNGNNSFSIAAHPTVMFSEYSVTIAKNLTEMFKHDHTEN